MARVISTYHESRRPVWQDDKTLEQKFKNATEGMHYVSAGFETHMRPLYWKDADGSDHPIGASGLIRGTADFDPEERYIATVTDHYHPIQHADFAAMLDSFPSEYPLEMVSLMGRYNERLMYAFNFGMHDVGGFESEASKNWVYIDNCNDGGSGIHMKRVSMRMYCTNQNLSFARNASFKVNIKHTQTAVVDTAQWIHYLDRLKKGIEAEQTVFDRMAHTKLARTQRDAVLEAEAIIAEVYTPRMPALVSQFGFEGGGSLPDAVGRARASYAAALERMETYRIGAVDEYDKLCDEFPAIAGTQWALYNAITHEENWRPAGRKTGVSGLEQVINGERAATMQKAFSLVQKVKA